tara:strand:+ start:918 stop:1649 length:732 start_codon:yes stop_codon:yes gene_type:complete
MEKTSYQNTLKSLENFILNSSVEISYYNFVLAIIFSAFLAYIIKIVYIKTSRSLNDKEHFSDIFVPLAIITTLVITIIKFSLALSLGLVGALSIVRFRAAIKEPEELVFLFFIIAIGLANGANHFLAALITTIIILAILFAKKIFLDKKKNQSITDNSTNIIQIEIAHSKNGNDLQKIIEKLESKTKYLKLKSLRTDSDLKQYNFWFDIDKKNMKDFISSIDQISSSEKNISIHLYSRSGIYE